MNADICNPDDTAAVERLRSTLRRLGAVLASKDWAPDVYVWRLNIGEDELTVFCDQWSVDIEGSDDLVRRVVREYEKTAG